MPSKKEAVRFDGLKTYVLHILKEPGPDMMLCACEYEYNRSLLKHPSYTTVKPSMTHPHVLIQTTHPLILISSCD